jgi:RimJ/RimL family protein N-acetyltransferase
MPGLEPGIHDLLCYDDGRGNLLLQPRPMIHLTTERLILRDWEASDLDAWAAINADAEVRRHLGDGTPVDREDSWHMMAAAAGNQALNGFGMWAAEERSSGQLIGRIGLYQPPHFPDLEVNWLLGRPWWGRGFAGKVRRPVSPILSAPWIGRVSRPSSKPKMRAPSPSRSAWA